MDGPPKCPEENMRSIGSFDEVPHEVPGRGWVWIEKPLLQLVFIEYTCCVGPWGLPAEEVRWDPALRENYTGDQLVPCHDPEVIALREWNGVGTFWGR